MNELQKRNAEVGQHIPANDFGNLKIVASVPRCYIGQSSNVSGYTAGKFNFDKILGWEPTDRLLDVVLIKPNQGFVMFGETFQSPSRCGSSDGIAPDARYTEPISSDCSHCPMNKWSNTLTPEKLEQKHAVQRALKRQTHDEKPDCSEKIELLLCDGRMIPFVLTGMKTQVSIIQKTLINTLRYKSRGKRVFETAFDIRLVPGASKKGNYVELHFDNFRPQTDDIKANAFMELAVEYQNFMAVMREQNAALDREREVGYEPQF
jgi:hypothetical protein